MKRILTTLMACSLLFITALSYAQVEVPVFNPASGTLLYEPTEVAITCATPGAVIRYTTDGKNPVDTSTICTGTVLVDKAMTIKAKAWVNDSTYSAVASASYTFPTEYATIGAFKAANKTLNKVVYKIAGDVTVTFVNDRYIFVQDTTAALMVYDRDGICTHAYKNGDVIKGGICGLYNKYNTMNEFIPTHDFAAPVAGTAVEPVVMDPTKLYDNFVANEARLVMLQDVKFESHDAFGKGSTLGKKSMSVGPKMFYCYNEFGTIEGVIPPSAPANVSGIVIVFNSEKRIAPRDANDVVVNDTTTIPYVSIVAPEADAVINGVVKLDVAVKNFEVAEGKGGVKVVMDNANTTWFNLDTLKAHEFELASGNHTVTVSLVDTNSAAVANAFSETRAFVVDLPDAPAPVFSVEPGVVFDDQLTVNITCTDTNATIYYTTDDTKPTATSTAYDAETGVVLTKTATLKAVAMIADMDASDVTEARYAFPTLTVVAPADGAVITDKVALDITVNNYNLGATADGVLSIDIVNAEVNKHIDVTSADELAMLKYQHLDLASGVYTLTVNVNANKVVGETPTMTIEQTFEVKKPKTAAPEFSPKGGLFNKDVEVELTCATEGATILYSINGGAEKTYDTPIAIATADMPVTIKAKATSAELEASEEVEATYEYTDKPAIYASAEVISLKARNDKQTFYVSGVNLGENIKVASNKANFRSSVASLNYNVTDAPVTITYVGTKNDTALITLTSINHYDTVKTVVKAIADLFVATPSFSPAYATTSYVAPIDVTISCATEGATIRYTLDGTNPDENSEIYSAPINISKTTTIKAKAWKETQAASEIGVATYVFPTIDMNVPAEGQVFVNAFKLDLKVNNFPIDEAADGLLKVELPGQEATYWTSDTLRKLLALPIDLPAGDYAITMSLVRDDKSPINAPVSVTHNFTVKVAAPEFLPEPGKFYSSKNIQLTSETQGATIYYTVDGSVPTAASTLYINPFVIANTTTVKAIAVKNADTSEVAVGEYIYAVGIEEAEELAKIAVYPNPTVSVVNVATGNLKTTQYDIIGLNGQLIFTETSVKNGDFQVSMENYPSGVYFLRIFTDKGVAVKKISKM